MGVRSLSLAALLGAALTSVACPFPDRTFGTGGIAIGGGGLPAADVLVFTVQPSGAVAGNIITPAIQVEVRDSLGAPDSVFASAVTISIQTNPVGGNLSGTTSVVPANGVAVFGDLSIDRSGAGYSLRATAPSATGATSASFTITAQ